MSGWGSGCRWWVYGILMGSVISMIDLPRYTVPSDWCTKGWLMDSAAATTLWPDLLYRDHTINSRIPLDMVEGTFQTP